MSRHLPNAIYRGWEISGAERATEFVLLARVWPAIALTGLVFGASHSVGIAEKIPPAVLLTSAD